MKNKPLLIAAGLLAASLLDAQSLLYEFNFNNPAENTSTSSTAPVASTANFTNYVEVGGTARVAANLYGANQTGVSGLAGDYAFDNTGSTRMGGSGAVNGPNAGYGGVARVTNGGNLVNGSTSFTVQGWYNASVAPANFARLIQIGTFGVWFQTDGGNTTLRVSARINDPTSTAQLVESDAAFMRQADTWTFFAFTYDGATGAANLYGGTDSTSVSLLVSTTISAGFLATNNNQAISIGNSTDNDTQRPFDGYLDNFRVWGESSGSAGALSLAQLEAVRLADTTNTAIPEPSSFAILAGLGTLGFALARRRSRLA